ncbi:hypothetical protein DACRYDRAFT_111189 [Dacryopinax primogenitus]|uniref:Uncharacterized protein n=1 Tax=Dacryopinax primogenitus (strain DJM 731) TaxID=1858805 RepID=M5FP50_DACPD|nr:uncharacterized protein DACRYDRAFT_111189 [Dacryopinax primogenitus]EJT98215.1 hypothetical protein DACRYDRAFT_111189 [Dacryopinax primogenitus]
MLVTLTYSSGAHVTRNLVDVAPLEAIRGAIVDLFEHFNGMGGWAEDDEPLVSALVEYPVATAVDESASANHLQVSKPTQAVKSSAIANHLQLSEDQKRHEECMEAGAQIAYLLYRVAIAPADVVENIAMGFWGYISQCGALY